MWAGISIVDSGVGEKLYLREALDAALARHRAPFEQLLYDRLAIALMLMGCVSCVEPPASRLGDR